MASVALVVAAAGLPDAGLAVSALLLVQTVPRFLGPVAGAIADRLDSRRLMVACDAGQAVIVAGLGLSWPPFGLVLGGIFVMTMLATIFTPTRTSAVARLVPAEGLAPANATLGAATSIGLVLGPALGGFLVAGYETAAVLAVAGLCYVTSACLLATLSDLPPPVLPATRRGTLIESTRDRLRFVRHDPVARVLSIALFGAVAFAALENVALVFLARDVLQAGPTGYGLLDSGCSLGMIGAALALARFGRRLALGRLLILGLIVSAGGLIGAAIAPVLLVALVGLVGGGIGNARENVATDTILQRSVSPALLGRVLGVVYAATEGGAAVAYPLEGPIIGLLAARGTLLVRGLGLMVVGLAVGRVFSRMNDERRAAWA